MHPDLTFRLTERESLLERLRAHPFCTIAGVLDGRPSVAHAPMIVREAGAALDFHLSRNNPLAAMIDGADVVVTQLGPDAYISPDWYERHDQVPTWNYRLIQIEGRVIRLDEAALVEQLSALSEQEEARLAPKPPWSMNKVPEAKFAGLLRGIVGFRLAVERIEGVDKLSQNKPATDRAGVVAGLRSHPLAAFIPQD